MPVAEAMETEVEVVLDEQRLRPAKSEVDRLWCDDAKARRLFGWQPAYGGRDGLRRGLAETTAWLADQENLRGYRPHEYAL